MNISAFSPASIWNNATRTLTGMGTVTMPLQSSVNVSLAANTTASFAQPAGRGALNTLAAVADASGTVVIQFTDGTNTWTAQTIAAGSTGGQDITCGVTAVFWQIHNNSATVAAHYFAAGMGWQQ